MADGLYLDENVSGRLGTALESLGHDVVTTAELGRKGASDVSQLSFAARTRRVLITHDTGHFEMLHEAWLSWSREWQVADRVRHPGLLFLPDPGILHIADAARLVNELLATGATLVNRLWAWKPTTGWQEIEVDA